MNMGKRTRNTYTEWTKTKALKLMMPPSCKTTREVSELMQIPFATLHAWKISELDRVAEVKEKTKKFEADLKEVATKLRDQKSLSPKTLVVVAMAEVLVLIAFTLIILKVWG